MNKVIECTSLKQISEIVSANLVTVIKLWAPWCGPCKAYTPIIEEVRNSITSTDVAVISVDVDKCPDVAKQYNVRSIPTVIIMNNYEQTPVETIVGVKTKDYLVDIIDNAISIADTYCENAKSTSKKEVLFTFNEEPNGAGLLLLPKNAEVGALYKNSDHFNEGDPAVKLFIIEDMSILPHTLGNTIKLGITCALTNNESYFLMAQPSIVKTPLRLSDSLGLISANYRGEITVSVDNVSSFEYSISKGDSIFQLVPFGGKGLSSLTIVDTPSETGNGTLHK